jgi:hypothetical protein
VSAKETYKVSEDGGTPPATGWQETRPTSAEQKGKYLWTKTETTFKVGTTSLSSVTSYSVVYSGNDGEKGDPGTSVTEVSATETYQLSDGGVTPPAGTWLETRPPSADQKGKYLWTKTVTTFKVGSTSLSPVTSYSVAYSGKDGTNGAKGEKGEKGDTAYPEVWDSSPTPQFIGYLLSTGRENDTEVLTILRPTGTGANRKEWYFKMTWEGKIAVDTSVDSYLYYQTMSANAPVYGKETWIPYRIFGHPWDGSVEGSSPVIDSVPTMYTFNAITTDGLASGSSVSCTKYVDVEGTERVIGAVNVYLLKKITWTDIGLTAQPVKPLKIVVP